MRIFDDGLDRTAPAAHIVDVSSGTPLLCARCRSPITSTDLRIEVMGLHVHHCENPHGYVYDIGCFAAATGCVIVSNPSSEWSWFPGYRWQIEACARCREHLGWLFSRHDGSFHGFIVDRLVEEPRA